jgi:hypothetical protein
LPVLDTALVLISSHVSQVPHGVRPPAQFTSVPPRLACISRSMPSRSTRVVVPPPARWPPPMSPVSYIAAARIGVPAPTSWLRISTVSRPRPGVPRESARS